jgi:hypothetical protein|eukprot:COSAG01_NODE_1955_length_8791_cov_6.011474_8_plen_35_part_00
MQRGAARVVEISKVSDQSGLHSAVANSFNRAHAH